MDVNAEWPEFDLFLLIARRSIGYQSLPNKRLDQAASARKKTFKERRMKVTDNLNRPRIWVRRELGQVRGLWLIKSISLSDIVGFET